MSLMPIASAIKLSEYAFKCGKRGLTFVGKAPLSPMISGHFKQRQAYPINPYIRCYAVLPKKGALQNNQAVNTLFREHLIPPVPVTAFGKAEWKRCYGVDVSEVPPLPANIQAKLNASCPFWPSKKVGDTHLLTLIPATVNGKPYHLNVLGELIEVPKDPSRAKRISYEWPSIKAEQGMISPAKSHWVLMPKCVVPGSRDKTRSEQQKIAEDAGYRLPTVLEAATVALMHYAQTGEFIFNEWTSTFTCCRELSWGYKSVVGGSFGSGLVIGINHRSWDVFTGVAPLQEVEGQS